MTLIFDIETKALGKPNSNKDEFKFFAGYSIEEDKYHFTNNHDEIKNIFSKHKVIVGFNSKNYDVPILKRYGLMRYKHIHIDLLEILRKREVVLGIKNESKALANIAQIFNLTELKSELDYTLLHKESLTTSEYERIKSYTIQDIKVTKEVFDYLCKFFDCFKGFMSKFDIMSYKWLTSSISVYSYKVICNATGIKEEYDDTIEHVKYQGGYVAEPSINEAHDDIYCLDFNSLYPHNMIQSNLFSYKCKCCNENEKWRGNNLFPIKGSYCSKKIGKIENKIHEIYLLRKELKKQKDKREYALKIVINTLYGLTGNSVFKNLYNYNSAHDCTLIGRESVKLARKIFRDTGYDVLYTDTDSVFLKDKFKDKERLLLVKNNIVNKIKKNLPFQVETFDMAIDSEIKHIWFFNKNNKYLKKHYLYVDNNNKLIIKGLPMIKNDSSKIGLKIFNEQMREEVKTGNIKFSYEKIKEWLYDYLINDITIATRKFKVSSVDYYKNENQLQAQISNKYGEGIHLLLPNKYYGVGKSIKYCTIEEFKEKGFNLNALVLNKFWKEMEFFSNYVPKKFKMGKDNSQIELLAWTNLI